MAMPSHQLIVDCISAYGVNNNLNSANDHIKRLETDLEKIFEDEDENIPFPSVILTFILLGVF